MFRNLVAAQLFSLFLAVLAGPAGALTLEAGEVPSGGSRRPRASAEGGSLAEMAAYRAHERRVARARLMSTRAVGGPASLGLRVDDRIEGARASWWDGRGAAVVALDDAVPADRGELLAGDVIVRYAGIWVDSVDTLTRLVTRTEPGFVQEVLFLREGRLLATRVTPVVVELKVPVAHRGTGKRRPPDPSVAQHPPPGPELDELNRALTLVGAQEGARLPSIGSKPVADLDQGVFDHAWMVSVLSDPEAFTEIHAEVYERGAPDPARLPVEHERALALLDAVLERLVPPAHFTTTDEELPLVPVFFDPLVGLSYLTGR